jgi:hypothetical protein
MNEENTLPKLERCVACGAYSADPELYPQNEQDHPELTDCGCQDIAEIMYVTHDMAIDAGDMSLEGQRYN